MLTRNDMRTLIDEQNKRIAELEAENQRLREGIRKGKAEFEDNRDAGEIFDDLIALSGEE